ncbi:MAG: AsnC family transcriptional regulator [Acidovorax sp. SCN 65-108]|jgi:Lrp/AsnC family leucine-responsive transcriptional regulator|nr:MAG: AsnC family transcriptional regulator [Acidovorax sp. SCN 65-108]OJV73555.1 MAG: AsnC family transcriptional regulator [Burkholderiales bacterium 64-34]
MPATPALDHFDIAILDILQTDNTTPQRVIAQAVNLSAPAVQRRIQRLKDSGVIRANVAVLDPVKVGKPLTIVLEVHLENERPDRTAPLRARIAGEDAVQQCYSVTGEADYLLVVNVASMADYEALTQRLFEGDDNIKRFRTSVALASLKTGLRVPLDMNSKENSIKTPENSPA